MVLEIYNKIHDNMHCPSKSRILQPATNLNKFSYFFWNLLPHF